VVNSNPCGAIWFMFNPNDRFIMSYNKNKFEHNLKKAKRQNRDERLLLNNIFSGYSKTLIEICNPNTLKDE
jgi:hypothetical protein